MEYTTTSAAVITGGNIQTLGIGWFPKCCTAAPLIALLSNIVGTAIIAVIIDLGSKTRCEGNKYRDVRKTHFHTNRKDIIKEE
jgi:hypothetical protein